MLKKWDEIPDFMKCEEVKFYYDILLKKKLSIKVKRIFDIALASFMLIILAVPMIIISIMIKIDSQGPVFYRQERITAYGKKFRIHKFRTMVNNADKIGTSVTIDEDSRITIVGSKLRSLRIDEIPQLLDVLSGNMSFVGTRPEATKYVEKYTKEMRATLLLPAGITSEASIRYKDEAKLLRGTENIRTTYINRHSVNEDIEHGIALEIMPIDGCPTFFLSRWRQININRYYEYAYKLDSIALGIQIFFLVLSQLDPAFYKPVFWGFYGVSIIFMCGSKKFMYLGKQKQMEIKKG